MYHGFWKSQSQNYHIFVSRPSRPRGIYRYRTREPILFDFPIDCRHKMGHHRTYHLVSTRITVHHLAKVQFLVDKARLEATGRFAVHGNVELMGGKRLVKASKFDFRWKKLRKVRWPAPQACIRIRRISRSASPSSSCRWRPCKWTARLCSPCWWRWVDASERPKLGLEQKGCGLGTYPRIEGAK
jgi:hypothetical protein